MNYYDDERMIIESFPNVRNAEVHFPFRSRDTIEVFKSVRNTKMGKLDIQYRNGSSIDLLVFFMPLDHSLGSTNSTCRVQPAS